MLTDLIYTLASSEAMSPLREGMRGGARRQWISGVRGMGKSLAVAAALHIRRTVQAPRVEVILTPSQERAETLFADLNALFGQHGGGPSLAMLPSLEGLLYEETSPDFQLIRERITVLARLAAGEPMLLITTPDAALHRTLPPEDMLIAMRQARVGQEIDPLALSEQLAWAGYSREALVEQPGQFSLRGGVLDIFPSTETEPVRLEFFGDEIESIRTFDPATQRSLVAKSEVTLFPAREMLITPERMAIAEPAIREALAVRLRELPHEPIRVPGEDGKPEELLSPAERLSAKIEHELALLTQGAYFTGAEYYLPYLYHEGMTLLDYLPAETAVILDEPEHIEEAYHRFQEGLEQLRASRLNRGALLPTPHSLYLPLEDGFKALETYPQVVVSLLGDVSSQTPSPASEEGKEIPSTGLSLLLHPSPSGRGAGGEGVRSRSESPASNYPPFPEGEGAGGRGYIDLACESPTNYAFAVNELQIDLTRWQREGYAIAVATHQERRLSEVFGEIGLPVLSGESAQPQADAVAPVGVVLVRRVELNEGVVIPGAKIALLTDSELLGWQKQRRSVRRRQQAPGQAIDAVSQLVPGEHVVHINHGIGRYAGLVRREVQGVEREFLQIDYAGEDKLYVPVDQLDRVQKYLSLGDNPPEVHRLGGGEWERIKRRTKKSTEELANQLLKLQALRSREPGHAFSPDSPWQREMEEGFPWQETQDQLRAIAEVKHDMEQPHPMDRLVCGDVGYGKTEVAIRAAFKAVMDGKQVAVLAPTTVLAAQHFRNFRERMAAFPVKVELLSRSVSNRDQTRIVAETSAGAVDIVIGTHRLLSKDIKFKNLGLVIIDEEQRFGVKQKERFKQMEGTVDVMTMTATPIPRTLHMALAGLREMSLIATPPEGRMPVRTLALEADDEVLREAILRELDRDGQVFILHNRISSIYHIAEHIRKVVPQARVDVAHGQMAEGELDRIMFDFVERDFDVLVCTAIIENGIDLPNVNTIIVDEADKFGLAQLYQVRGRVGRSDRQAYAYLTWKPRKKLSVMAQERIGALKEFSHLGSGYKLALRDLEIRGAGNLLGAEQSGVLAAVGYDLYCRMLEEAVAMVKGEYIEPEREVQIDLPLDAFIPEDYVPELNQRIDLYRRLAAVRQWKFAEDLRDEMLDRFGKPLPTPVENLFRLMAVKLVCLETGIVYIGTERDAIVLRLQPERALSPQAVKRLQFEAPEWRKRGLPAPAYTPVRATIFTINMNQETMLSMLEEVADRLRHIEGEVAKGPRTLATPPSPTARRDADWRPFGK